MSSEQVAIESGVDDFDVSMSTGEPEFDRYGRYLIPDVEFMADGMPYKVGNRKSRMRSTTFAKRIADTFTLNQWQARTGGYGLMLDAARQGTMLRRMYRLDLEKDKKALDAIMDEAHTLAGGKTGAVTGTRYHNLTEALDRGESLPDDVTDVEKRDMLAYVTCLGKHKIGIDPGLIEQTVLIPNLNVAGTFDRLVWYQGVLTVLDLKTGNIDYAESEICIQLWLYAQAVAIFNWKTDEFERMPEVRQDYGLVVHLKAGSGLAELHRVPFSRGRRGAAVSVAVGNYRADSDGLTRIPDPDSPKLIDQLYYAQSVADVQAIWNKATTAQRNQVRFPAAVKAKLDEFKQKEVSG